MGNTVLFWRYPTDSDDASQTASTTAGAGFGVGNLAKYSLTNKWRSSTAGTVETLDCDFGTPQLVDTFAALGTNIAQTDTLELKYASDSGFTTDVVTINPTWKDGYLFERFSQVTRQYRRLTITRLSSADYREIGRMVDGTSTVLERGFSTPGFAHGPALTTSQKSRSLAGVTYGALGTIVDRLMGKFPALGASDVAELELVQEYYQDVIPFIMAVREGDADEKLMYGTLDRIEPPKEITPNDWEWNWNMTEQL